MFDTLFGEGRLGGGIVEAATSIPPVVLLPMLIASLKEKSHRTCLLRAPSKYQVVVNLKTAKAFGMVVPASVLARADQAIE